jgi:hypothetical protein
MPPHSRRSCHGNIDFDRDTAAAERAGVCCHFVERDRPADPLASIRSSCAYLTGPS